MRAPRSSRSAAALAVVVLLVAGCDGSSSDTDDGVVVHATAVPALHPSVDGYDDATLEIATADGERHRLAVKVAATREQQLHGLMEVEEVPDGTGMWFAFDQSRTGGFWMYSTLVPLSIAYVDADGVVVDVLDMEPCPAEAGRDCPSYPPDAPYRFALEVPKGWFAEHGIAAGDQVTVLGG